MALIDRRKRRNKPNQTPGSGEPFATIDADRYDRMGDSEDRRRLMEAADRYNAAAKQRPRPS